MRYKELDKYYTKPAVVEKCLASLAGMMRLYDYIVEPSAGNGAFLEKIKHKNKIGLDIYPENKNVIKKDWFKFKIKPVYKSVLVVGNPPFGQYHSLSDAFLRHSFYFNNVRTVAFILPNTYHKHHRQKIIPYNWRIRKIIPLDRDCFTFNGQTRHCPCSFFVFDKSQGTDLRVNPHTIKTSDFIFSKPNQADFFIFGAAPNKIIKQPLKNNRGYYIKALIDKNKLAYRLKNMKWAGHSCANGGVAWFTKIEIIQQYNKHFLYKQNQRLKAFTNAAQMLLPA